MSCTVCLAIITIVLVAIGLKIKKLFERRAIPQLQEQWWGPGEVKATNTAITPFTIAVEQKVLDDLEQRLINARPFTPPLEDVQQQYGMNAKLLSEIVEFWRSKYNWREREAFLNQFPQFKTNVQGLDIHFLHVKPAAVEKLKVVPLLLLHGWPGSVREFYEFIPLLTQPRPGKDFVFEVIAPSLPGFGFSSGASKRGLGPAKMAVIFKNLMNRVGYKKFYVQGGDWGGIIASHMATLFPEAVLGAHMNLTFVRSHPMVVIKTLLKTYLPALFASESDRRMMEQSRIYPTRESGYFQIQATKPDTVGVGLNDSPVGLAAYILEKFTTWTNPNWIARADGGLLEKYDYTKLLDNVMIYWVTNSITTSVRIYYEHAQEDQKLEMDKILVTVPTAVAKFQHELILQPDDVLKYKYVNLIHSSEIPNGGHFAALEVPEALADDVWKAVNKFLEYYEQNKH